MRKDKEKVLEEVWTEDRVRSFLDYLPLEGTNADFHCLLKAYQSMRASDFEIFVRFFKDQSRDVNAQNPEGQSVLSIVSTHRHGADYADILHAAGAV
ncbi:MAG: PA4642 family protein [Pseudomonadota bacterium]